MSILDDLFDTLRKKTSVYSIEKIEEFEKSISSLNQQVFKNQIQQYKELAGLRSEVEQLALLFRTLFDLCLEKEIFTKDEYRALFEKIDKEDGKVDGKLSRPKSHAPKKPLKKK